MTTPNGERCGNCAAFMPDPFNFGDQGACAVVDDDNIAFGTYSWTTADGDCAGWTPKEGHEKPKRSPKEERELYQRRMEGDWS